MLQLAVGENPLLHGYGPAVEIRQFAHLDGIPTCHDIAMQMQIMGAKAQELAPLRGIDDTRGQWESAIADPLQHAAEIRFGMQLEAYPQTLPDQAQIRRTDTLVITVAIDIVDWRPITIHQYRNTPMPVEPSLFVGRQVEQPGCLGGTRPGQNGQPQRERQQSASAPPVHRYAPVTRASSMESRIACHAVTRRQTRMRLFAGIAWSASEAMPASPASSSSHSKSLIPLAGSRSFSHWSKRRLESLV